MRFSVIVLTYNSSLEDIVKSLDSILKQKDVKLEIIVSDDGSKLNHENEIRDYFLINNFSRYKIANTGQNIGTVKNVLNGIECASGDIIKLIGAGDYLYSDTTLKQVEKFMLNNNCKCCFGDMIAYSYDDNNHVIFANYFYPRDISVYDKRKKSNLKYRNIIEYEDWISGASMFFERKCLYKYLKNMDGIVKYCEDLITAELALNDIYFMHIKNPVIFYKVGDGISTQKNSLFEERLKDDHIKYWKYLEDKYHSEYLKRCNKKRKLLKEKSKIYYYLINPKKIIFEFHTRFQLGKRKLLDNRNK